VRADAAAPVDLQPNAPNWILMPYKQRAAVAGWLVEERCSTFTVVVHDGTPQRLEGFKLAAVDGGGGAADGETAVAADFEGGTDAGGASGGAPAAPPKPLHVSVKVGQVNLLIRSLLRTPILELEMREVKVGAFFGGCNREAGAGWALKRERLPCLGGGWRRGGGPHQADQPWPR
jgi:hypothetical protein